MAFHLIHHTGRSCDSVITEIYAQLYKLHMSNLAEHVGKHVES